MGDANDPLADAARRAFAAPFGAILKLAPEENAAIWIDGRKSPPAVMTAAPEETMQADCTVVGPRDALLRVMSGARALDSAYVAGRITIAGDMSVMARLNLATAR